MIKTSVEMIRSSGDSKWPDTVPSSIALSLKRSPAASVIR
jgi:hypothetical protein